jgi:hypothetical protein
VFVNHYLEGKTSHGSGYITKGCNFVLNQSLPNGFTVETSGFLFEEVVKCPKTNTIKLLTIGSRCAGA